MLYHPDVEVVSGTPIVINGILYDAAGNLLDVTNCTLAWGLLDPDGNPVSPLAVTISKTDPVNGAISIEVPATYTDLRPGRYTDALQVTAGMSTDLFWTGWVLVCANPFIVINDIEPASPFAPSSVAE
jgi:hypothetical protein